MFAEERQNKIKEILVQYKQIDINSLSSMLSSSLPTIRRDLEKLDSEGFLTKTHGGAVINEQQFIESKISLIPDPLEKEKLQISYMAANLIDNNDIVFIGGGNTGLQIAKQLKGKSNIKVITNSMNIAHEIKRDSNFKVIITGGNMDMSNSDIVLTGQYAMLVIDNMYIKKSFISVDGIQPSGYTLDDADLCEFYRCLIKNTEEIYIMADNTKFNKRAFAELGGLNLAHKIITDKGLSGEIMNSFTSIGIQVIIS